MLNNGAIVRLNGSSSRGNAFWEPLRRLLRTIGGSRGFPNRNSNYENAILAIGPKQIQMMKMLFLAAGTLTNDDIRLQIQELKREIEERQLTRMGHFGPNCSRENVAVLQTLLREWRDDVEQRKQSYKQSNSRQLYASLTYKLIYEFSHTN